jgi:hypothetical protein
MNAHQRRIRKRNRFNSNPFKLKTGDFVKCVNSSCGTNTTYKEIENKALIVEWIDQDELMLRVKGVSYPFRVDRFEKLDENSIEVRMYKMGYK